MRRLAQLLVLILGTGVLVLAGSEVALRVIEARALGDLRVARKDELISDRLGVRLAPFANGSDAHGFRNDWVPETSTVVALGDSQTWGVGAPRSESWPAQLARRLNERVYNMSMGGWGPAHYFAVLPDVLRFAPRIVIVGLYFGNDLYDTYRLAYSDGEFANLRADVDISAVDTVATKAWAAVQVEKRFEATYGLDEPRLWALWLRGHSALGRALDRSWPTERADAWYEIGAAWAQAYPEYGATFDDGGVRTVFTTAYRLLAVDLSEVRIREGLRLTKILLPRIALTVDRHDSRLVVLLIPSKETAFAARVAASGQASTVTYRHLIEQEARCRSSILQTCAAAEIECLDLLPAFEAALGQGLQIYPTNTESHPNSSGYAVVSQTLEGRLRELKWLPLGRSAPRLDNH